VASTLRSTVHTRLVRHGSSNHKLVQPFSGYNLEDAVRLVQAYATANFPENIQLTVRTGLDPRKPNQMVRGLVTLPHGTGKSPRIAVFAKGPKAEAAKEAGADIVGQQDLADEILAGNIDFTRCMATPDMMPVVGKVARVLGPRGLMPNPKMGTVTMNIAEAVQTAKLGEFEFKCTKDGDVFVPVGKVDFSRQQLEENIRAFIDRMEELKPAGARGTYIGRMFISSDQGKGTKIDITKAPFYMREQF